MVSVTNNSTQQVVRLYLHRDGKVDKSLQSVVFRVDVKKTRQELLAQEDSNGDGNITVDDDGPKQFLLHDLDGSGHTITGNYQLANLLQELTLAEDHAAQESSVSGARICENPVERLSRMIKDLFWEKLTRRLDASQVFVAAKDPKFPREVRIYVPHDLPEQNSYYRRLSDSHPERGLEVVTMPETWSIEDYAHQVRKKPGILALAMKTCDRDFEGLSYIVPGYRFHELYYWDSHFAALGLLEAGKVGLVRDVVDNMRFQIDHYGCVLNANRSYYLGRSQPPFLTDLVIRTYRAMCSSHDTDAEGFLRRGIISAIKEYYQVWTSSPRLDTDTGLSKYGSSGRGIPAEVEDGHFDWYLAHFARRCGKSIAQVCAGYNEGTLESAELDAFFSHDRAMRESGHDTSARFCGQAGSLATIDLNALLYKYETDIAWAIKSRFNDHLEVPQESLRVPGEFDSAFWTDKARVRRSLVNQYLWNHDTGMFHDYNTVDRIRTSYKSVTTFYTLWSGLASPEQARTMRSRALPQFEEIGGLTSTVQASIQVKANHNVDLEQPKRQWDYPFGWAPHQMIAWEGLVSYGFTADACRLAYRWLYLITRLAVDYNGMVTERYNVTSWSKPSANDDAEYGNQGAQFRGINFQGFGWTNASYLVGLRLLGPTTLASLKKGLRPEELTDFVA